MSLPESDFDSPNVGCVLLLSGVGMARGGKLSQIPWTEGR